MMYIVQCTMSFSMLGSDSFGENSLTWQTTLGVNGAEDCFKNMFSRYVYIVFELQHFFPLFKKIFNTFLFKMSSLIFFFGYSRTMVKNHFQIQIWVSFQN